MYNIRSSFGSSNGIGLITILILLLTFRSLVNFTPSLCGVCANCVCPDSSDLYCFFYSLYFRYTPVSSEIHQWTIDQSNNVKYPSDQLFEGYKFPSIAKGFNYRRGNHKLLRALYSPNYSKKSHSIPGRLIDILFYNPDRLAAAIQRGNRAPLRVYLQPGQQQQQPNNFQFNNPNLQHGQPPGQLPFPQDNLGIPVAPFNPNNADGGQPIGLGLGAPPTYTSLLESNENNSVGGGSRYDGEEEAQMLKALADSLGLNTTEFFEAGLDEFYRDFNFGGSTETSASESNAFASTSQSQSSSQSASGVERHESCTDNNPAPYPQTNGASYSTWTSASTGIDCGNQFAFLESSSAASTFPITGLEVEQGLPHGLGLVKDRPELSRPQCGSSSSSLCANPMQDPGHCSSSSFRNEYSSSLHSSVFAQGNSCSGSDPERAYSSRPRNSNPNGHEIDPSNAAAGFGFAAAAAIAVVAAASASISGSGDSDPEANKDGKRKKSASGNNQDKRNSSSSGQNDMPIQSNFGFGFVSRNPNPSGLGLGSNENGQQMHTFQVPSILSEPQTAINELNSEVPYGQPLSFGQFPMVASSNGESLLASLDRADSVTVERDAQQSFMHSNLYDSTQNSIPLPGQMNFVGHMDQGQMQAQSQNIMSHSMLTEPFMEASQSQPVQLHLQMANESSPVHLAAMNYLDGSASMQPNQLTNAAYSSLPSELYKNNSQPAFLNYRSISGSSNNSLSSSNSQEVGWSSSVSQNILAQHTVVGLRTSPNDSPVITRMPSSLHLDSPPTGPSSLPPLPLADASLFTLNLSPPIPSSYSLISSQISLGEPISLTPPQVHGQGQGQAQESEAAQLLSLNLNLNMNNGVQNSFAQNVTSYSMLALQPGDQLMLAQAPIGNQNEPLSLVPVPLAASSLFLIRQPSASNAGAGLPLAMNNISENEVKPEIAHPNTFGLRAHAESTNIFRGVIVGPSPASTPTPSLASLPRPPSQSSHVGPHQSFSLETQGLATKAKPSRGNSSSFSFGGLKQMNEEDEVDDSAEGEENDHDVDFDENDDDDDDDESFSFSSSTHSNSFTRQRNARRSSNLSKQHGSSKRNHRFSTGSGSGLSGPSSGLAAAEDRDAERRRGRKRLIAGGPNALVRVRHNRTGPEIVLPFTERALVDSSFDEFTQMLAQPNLTAQQSQLMKDIRRRGKNRLAAQACRKRKADDMDEQVATVTTLESEISTIEDRIHRLKSATTRIERAYALLLTNLELENAAAQNRFAAASQPKSLKVETDSKQTKYEELDPDFKNSSMLPAQTEVVSRVTTPNSALGGQGSGVRSVSILHNPPRVPTPTTGRLTPQLVLSNLNANAASGGNVALNCSGQVAQQARTSIGQQHPLLRIQA